MPRILSPLDIRRFRERLCDIAAELLAETGPDGFNMRELAARAGVSAMTTYRYFKDKDEILAALRERAFLCLANRLEEAISTNNGVDKKLSAVAQAYMAFVYEDRFRYKMMFDFAQPASKSAEFEVGEAHLCRTFAEIGAFLAKNGKVTGEPDMIGRMLWSTLHGAMALNLTAKIRENDLSRLLSDALALFGGARDVAIDFHPEQPNGHDKSDSPTPSNYNAFAVAL